MCAFRRVPAAAVRAGHESGKMSTTGHQENVQVLSEQTWGGTCKRGRQGKQDVDIYIMNGERDSSAWLRAISVVKYTYAGGTCRIKSQRCEIGT